MSKQQSHFTLIAPRLGLSDAEVLAFEAKARAEFGEEGVQRFRELMAEREPTPPSIPSSGSPQENMK